MVETTGWRVEVGAATLTEHYLVSPDGVRFLTGVTQEAAAIRDYLNAQDARITELEAQVTTLRAALQRIVDRQAHSTSIYDSGLPSNFELARNALKATEPGSVVD